MNRCDCCGISRDRAGAVKYRDMLGRYSASNPDACCGWLCLDDQSCQDRAVAKYTRPKLATTTITAEEAEAAFNGSWYPIAFVNGEVVNLQPISADERERVLESAAALMDALDPDVKA